MIDKDGGKFYLICDVCLEDGLPFASFDEAVAYKKDEKWKSKKIDGEWQDICPDCQKEAI